jgi:hypothetical protein
VPPTDRFKQEEIHLALRDLCITLNIGARQLTGCGPVRIILGLTTHGVSQLETVGNGNEVLTELDSHADTCVLGKNMLIIVDHECPVSVSGYDKSMSPVEHKTVSGGIGYVHPYDGKHYYLVIHQVIHIPLLQHNLLCPMQLRVNDIIIN